jgi:prepilin-type N-terminal cleavage/methylation domain-containing protein
VQPRRYMATCVLRQGFTLAELVVSMAVTAIIILAMGSSMLIASRAVPTAGSVTATRIGEAEAIEQMVTELQYATAINSRSATMIQFCVADRDGNDIPETIRYSWSGSPGTPLTRQYNGGPAVNIVTDVQQFSLAYNLKTLTVQTPQGIEGTETTLASYSATTSLADYKIASGEWYAEYFFPTLPANTISWKVTRVTVNAKYDATTDGEARVQLQLPTIDKCPSGIVLQESVLLESTLKKNYSTAEFTYSSVNGLSPGQGLCLVFKWVANAIAGKIQGRNSGVTETNLALATSAVNGASWSTLAGQSLLFTVYGTATTAGTPLTQNTYYLEGVDIVLRASSDSQSIVQTGARLLNRPEVSP